MQGGIRNTKNIAKLIVFSLLCVLGLVALAVLSRALFSGGVATFFTTIAPHFDLLSGAP
jgi:hypothetical protein